MTQQLFAFLILLAIVSCQQSVKMTENEKAIVTENVRQALDHYYDDIRKSGLTAEFNYLDDSPEFFWVPPGYPGPISYDSVVSILNQIAPQYKSIDNSFDTLRIIPLSNEVAAYTGRLHSMMTDTSGQVSTLLLAETGFFVKGNDGWKLSGGQTSILSQPARDQRESDRTKIDEVYSTMSLAYSTYDINLIEKIYADMAYAVYAGDTSSLSNRREKLLAGFQRSFDYHKERGISLDMKFKFIERKIDHDMAYDIGYYRIDKTDKAGIKTSGKPGKFVTVLQKHRDGSWKFQIDIYGDASANVFH